MAEIDGIRGDMRTQRDIQAIDLMAQATQAGQTEVAKEVQTVVPILRGGTTVTGTGSANAAQPGSQREVTGVEEIDQPDSQAAKMADMERLVAILLAESDEQQAKATEERIKSLVNKVNSEHEASLKKLSHAIDETQKMLKTQQAMRIFGWIMTAVAAIAAVAATIVTAGAAAPGVAAIVGLCCTWAGVAMSVITQAMTESGAMDKLIEKDAQKIYDKARSEGNAISMEEARAQAQSKATIIMTVISAVLAVASMGAGIAQAASKSVEKVAEETLKQTAKQTERSIKEAIKAVFKKMLDFLQKASVQKVAKIATVAGGGIGIAGGIASGAVNIDLAKSQKALADEQANLLEAQKILDSLQQLLEEENETLKEILSFILNDYAALADVLGKTNESTTQIFDIMAQSQV